MRKQILIAAALILILAAVGGWLTYQYMPSFLEQQTSPPTNNHAAKRPPAQPIDHIAIILEENKPATSIVGNPDAPYINQLINRYAYVANYTAITNPSLPNYIALTSGTTAGITNDCGPTDAGCQAKVRNIVDEVEASGRSWKAYMESMPVPCGMTNAGKYSVKHNPFVYYPDITDNAGRCQTHVVPYDELGTDLKSALSLPDFVFITPNMCNDMHDCPISTGDAWLAKQVPKLLSSSAFAHQNSLLIIVWDEGVIGNNQVPAIFVGPAAKQHYVSTNAYNHYSLLRTIENAWHLSPLTNNDRAAQPMTSMIKHG